MKMVVTVSIEHEGKSYSAQSPITEETVIGWDCSPDKLSKEINNRVADAARHALGEVGKQIICYTLKAPQNK